MGALHIKNMVCDRCILIVRQEIEKLGFHLNNIQLGYVEIEENLNQENLLSINSHLNSFGFELIFDKKEKLTEQIKNIIIELVHNKNDDLKKINHSSYLAEKMGKDYTYLSSLFSETEGTTIEKYFILQKTERVKELLSYEQMNLSQIAYLLNYSSVQHLSSQFKKITGLTPGKFKIKQSRKTLDKV